jgi:hypothetical protein
MTHTRHARPFMFTLALALLAVALVASPAVAAPLENVRNHVSTSDIVEDFCDGLTVRIDEEIDESILVNRHGPDGLAYFAAKVQGTFAVTNLTNDQTLTQEYAVLDKDLKVTDNGDGTLTILVLATGGERWYGPDGRLLFRNPGQIRYELVADHGGTPDDPSDDEVIAESDLVKGSTGRNDTEGRDFCDDVHTFIGDPV